MPESIRNICQFNTFIRNGNQISLLHILHSIDDKTYDDIVVYICYGSIDQSTCDKMKKIYGMNNRMMIIYINESGSPDKISTISERNNQVNDIPIENNYQFTKEYTLALSSLIDQSLIFSVENHDLYKKSKIYEFFLKEHPLNDPKQKYYLKKCSKSKLRLFSSKDYLNKCKTLYLNKISEICEVLNSPQDTICGSCSCSYKDHCLSRFQLKEIILENPENPNLANLITEFQSFNNALHEKASLQFDSKSLIPSDLSNKISDFKENIRIEYGNFEYFFGNIKEYTLENAQVVFVIGEEGSGKTTLIRQILNNQDEDLADKLFGEIEKKNHAHSTEGYKFYKLKKKGYLKSDLIIIESPSIQCLVNNVDQENIQGIISMIKSIPVISTIIYTHKSDTRSLNPSILQIRTLIQEEVQNVDKIKFIYVLTFYPGSLAYNDSNCEKNSLEIKINMISPTYNAIINEKLQKKCNKTLKKVEKLFKEIVYYDSSAEILEYACKEFLRSTENFTAKVYKQKTLDYFNLIERHEMEICFKLDKIEAIKGFDLNLYGKYFENMVCKNCGKDKNSHIISETMYEVEIVCLKDLIITLLNQSTDLFIEGLKKMLKNN